MLTVGAMAVIGGGITQSWPLLCFGAGLMSSTTLASVVLEDHQHNRKV